MGKLKDIFDDLKDDIVKIVAVIVIIAAAVVAGPAVAAALGGGAIATGVANIAINLAVGYSIGLIFASDPPVPLPDPGIATRVHASTSNKLPIVYGESRIRGTLVFADISADNKKLAFIIALTDGELEEIGTVRWEDNILTLDANGVVTDAVDADGVSDDFLNGGLKIIKAPNGGRSTEMEAFSSKWAANGANRTMPDMAYIYAELDYNRDKGVVALTSDLSFDIKGRKIRTLSETDGVVTLSETETYSNNPAECLIDYMTNVRYGCGDLFNDSDLNLNSFNDWKTFCDELKSYTDKDGNAATAKRYTTNGFISTATSRQHPLSDITACASGLLTYNQGEFGIIIETVASSVKSFDEDNIYGEVSISDQGFGSQLNSMVVKFAEKNNFYQESQVYLYTPQSVMNPNEPELVRDITMAFINNNIEAERVGTILLNESRNSQTVTFKTDMRVLELEPGDVITISNKAFGIQDKLYRILTISDGSIYGGVEAYSVLAKEYSDSVYTDLTLTEVDDAPNTNFPAPWRIETPSSLTVVNVEETAIIPTFDLRLIIPDNSLVSNIEYYYGPSTDFSFAKLWTTEGSTGTSYNAGDMVDTTITGLPTGIYYFFVRLTNTYAKSDTAETIQFVWNPSVLSSASVITPEWSKAAIVLSKDSNDDIILTNGIASLSVLLGAMKTQLIDTSTDAGLDPDQWRVTSVTSTDGVTQTFVINTTDDTVDVTITAFTTNATITVSYNFKDQFGDVSSLISSIDVTEAPRGPEGRDGNFTQLRYSDDLTQPAEATYPTNDNGTNDTWLVSSADAIWLLSREITFDAENTRTNGDWTISKLTGESGGDGIRGSGDWHQRAGETIADNLTQADLDDFLAMAIPGTEFDAPVNGDRLWLFASPSDTDLTVTDQKVWIQTGGSWIPQAEAIDGNLLVTGTVTADNVVANIGITAPSITGGSITGGSITGGTITGSSIVGSVVDAGVLRYTTRAFAVNQNSDTSIFDSLSEKRRSFTRAQGGEPARMVAEVVTNPDQNAAFTFSILQENRLFNVNQDVPDNLIDYANDPDLLRRNWYQSVPYEFSAYYPHQNLNSTDGEQYYGMLFPSCTFAVKSGNTTIGSMVLPSRYGSNRGDNTFNPIAGVNGTGIFADYNLFHGGSYNLNRYSSWGNTDSSTDRNDMTITGRGFIYLKDDEYVEVTLGSAAAGTGTYDFGQTALDVNVHMTAYSVGLEEDYNSKAQYYFDPNDSSQTDNADAAPTDVVKSIGTEADPIQLSIPPDALSSQEFNYDNVSNSLTLRTLPAEKISGVIDADTVEITNISPGSVLPGTMFDVDIKSGDIRLDPMLTLGQFHTLNDVIDSYTNNSEGLGFSLGNGGHPIPTFAIGDFDDAEPDAWVATDDYVLGDRVTYNSLYYIPSEDITGDAANTNPSVDTDRWDGIEIPRNSYLIYTTDTGLVVGGTITAGAVRGGNLLSSGIPTSGQSGAFIDLDNGTFLFGNDQEYFRYDGTNIIIAGVPVDGQLIETASITGDKIDINTIIARTIRSDNYVAPTLADNPPNQGYSLEHIEGIGFFEEIRADLTGTVTAPSQTPSMGTYDYNTSAITFEYLNISVGDTWDDFFATDEDGVINTHKGKLSDLPLWELTLPTNIQNNLSPLSITNYSGGSSIRLGAQYDWYSNLSTNSISNSAMFEIGLVWFGYDANDNRIGELGIANIEGNTIVSGLISIQAAGLFREIGSTTAVDLVDEIDQLGLSGNGVELGAEIPVTAKLHAIVVSRSSTINTSENIRPLDTSEIDITVGIRLNSSISFEVRSNDGTSQTSTITQVTS